MLCLRFADWFICFFTNSHVCQYASTTSFFRGRELPQTQVGQRTFFAVAKNRCPATPKKRQNQMLCLRFADWFICFLQTLTYANTLRPQAFFVAANNRKLKSGNVHFLQSQKIVVPQPPKNVKTKSEVCVLSIALFVFCKLSRMPIRFDREFFS